MALTGFGDTGAEPVSAGDDVGLLNFDGDTNGNGSRGEYVRRVEHLEHHVRNIVVGMSIAIVVVMLVAMLGAITGPWALHKVHQNDDKIDRAEARIDRVRANLTAANTTLRAIIDETNQTIHQNSLDIDTLQERTACLDCTITDLDDSRLTLAPTAHMKINYHRITDSTNVSQATFRCKSALSMSSDSKDDTFYVVGDASSNRVWFCYCSNVLGDGMQSSPEEICVEASLTTLPVLP